MSGKVIGKLFSLVFIFISSFQIFIAGIKYALIGKAAPIWITMTSGSASWKANLGIGILLIPGAVMLWIGSNKSDEELANEEEIDDLGLNKIIND